MLIELKMCTTPGCAKAGKTTQLTNQEYTTPTTTSNVVWLLLGGIFSAQQFGRNS